MFVIFLHVHYHLIFTFVATKCYISNSSRVVKKPRCSGMIPDLISRLLFYGSIYLYNVMFFTVACGNFRGLLESTVCYYNVQKGQNWNRIRICAHENLSFDHLVRRTNHDFLNLMTLLAVEVHHIWQRLNILST